MNEVVKGAVIQFAAHLTTMDSTHVVGSQHECSWLATEVEKWCVAHGLDCPMDADWDKHMGTPNLASVPLADLLFAVGQRIDTDHTKPWRG